MLKYSYLETHHKIRKITQKASKRITSFCKQIALIIALIATINNAYGLSATTVKEITGSEPYLLLSDGTTKVTTLEQLLSFKMPKQDGSEGTEEIDVSKVDTVLKIPAGMKYKDAVTLITADGALHNLDSLIVGDVDGDADVEENTNIIGEMKATWYDQGVAIPASELNEVISDCDGPYTLKIEIPTAISADTKYGIPNTTQYGTHDGVTYTFVPAKPRLCYLQPHSMHVYKNFVAGSTIKFSEGYNSAKWAVSRRDTSINKGFKAEAGFPTTGFRYAQFSLIGTGLDQSKYRCKMSNGNGKISLSNDVPINNDGKDYPAVGENCTVTYEPRTKAEFTAGGTPTITMEYNTGDDWIVIDSYHIPTPTKWAEYRGQTEYGSWHKADLSDSVVFPALDICQNSPEGTTSTRYGAGHDEEARLFRQKYLYRRDELSNSPYADRSLYPEDSAPAWVSNKFSRDVDGTFMGEWGYVYKYCNSGWAAYKNYWTAETYSTKNMFYVYSDGDVAYASVNIDKFVLMCRGD